MLKLKLHTLSLDSKNWLIWKDPDAGKDRRQEEKGATGWYGWMASLTPWTWVWASSGSWWQTGKPGGRQPMGSQRVGHNWVTEQTELITVKIEQIFKLYNFIIYVLYNINIYWSVHALLCFVTQSCLTLCDPMNCSLPDSSIHGILQARILEKVAMPSSRGIFPTQG